MTEFTLYAFVLNMIYFVGALLVGFFVLRGLDKLLGIEFKGTIFDEMARGNTAVAQYFGLRFLGVCVLASAFLR